MNKILSLMILAVLLFALIQIVQLGEDITTLESNNIKIAEQIIKLRNRIDLLEVTPIPDMTIAEKELLIFLEL